MKDRTSSKRPGLPSTLKRRELLCAAAAAGGALIATDGFAAGSPAPGTAISDPRLRAAMQKYGGEFGQFGKGGSHGDI